jgi:Initiator Replication protein
MSNFEIRKTAKLKKEIVLPANASTIFIPNRVTNAKYNYSLIQEKILNYVLYQLQDAIKTNMNGGNYKQLELFKEINQDRVGLSIPMKAVVSANHYAEVREAAENLGKSVIRITQVDPNSGKRETRSLFLFGAIVTPLDQTRNAMLKIELSKEVARLLVEIDINKMGKPSNYTSFQLQVALNAKNKYTPRIYKLISSWKEKGGFYTTLEEFRDWLQLGGKYKTYGELKRNILLPVQKELEGKALCWFNCSEKTFEKRTGKTVIGLQWKVITPELEQSREIQLNGIKNVLMLHYGFKDADIKQLQPVFDTIMDFTAIGTRIIELKKYMAENKGKIGNVKGYTIECLKREFGGKKA